MQYRHVVIGYVVALVFPPQLMANTITFGTPQRLDAPVSSAGADFGSGISPGGEALLFNFCPTFQSDCDIYAARADADGGFQAAEPLVGAVNTSANELYPSLTPDGLQLYFSDGLSAPFDNHRRRPGSQGGDLWVATRSSQIEDFSAVTNLAGEINTRSLEAYPHVSPDGLTLLFSSNRRGGQGSGDLYMATRDTLDDSFKNVTNLGPEVNSSANEGRATISSDALTLFFDSDRDGGFGNWDLWMATRTDTTQPFANPRNLGPDVNTPTLDSGPSLSAYGTSLYFESFRSPNHGLGSDLWSVPVHGMNLSASGDLDADGDCDADDIDALAAAVRNGQSDSHFDLNGDATVDLLDHAYFISELKNTWTGDSNLDGSFDSSDLIAVFQVGQYEDALVLNSGWAGGDWSGDSEFDSGDLVLAFQGGGYELGPRTAVSAVPEPSGIFLLAVGLLTLWMKLAPRNTTV